jgi:methylated-DNA-[protein]-cysteine S-methyltransferase
VNKSGSSQLSICTVPTAWGRVALAFSPKGLCGVLLPAATDDELQTLIHRCWPNGIERDVAPDALIDAIQAYFDGQPVTFDVTLDLDDRPPFQQRVLRACARIPYGQRRTYADLARTVGSPRAARAVGQAMARNPVPLIVPCHRVIASNGALGGFSAAQGVAMKERMLAMEARR